MHFASVATGITSSTQFEAQYRRLAKAMLNNEPTHRGAAHATKDETMASTHELLYMTETFILGDSRDDWARVVTPNLPWAEDHFQERVGGEPLNPAPSEQWWPFAREGNAEHKKGKIFSHTYPERFWPKRAGDVEDQAWDIESPISRGHFGIRFPYGDLADLIQILDKNPYSRQAYLPIWFPEDLTAARRGERVPCSMGYHFMSPGDQWMDCVYTMRSCDIVRFYRDDIYMAGRLLQLVSHQVGMVPQRLIVHVDNLHCFPGDRPFLESLLPKTEVQVDDKRANYNFGALG